MTLVPRRRLDDFRVQPLAICGKSLEACTSGALYWPGQRTLIVADLHLEKGSALASRGVMLPPYDTRETLIRLAEAIDRFEPEQVVALGDSFHDAQAEKRIQEADLEALRELRDGRRWIWITGNHDPVIAESLGGRSVPQLMLGGLCFRHEPTEGRMTHEIAGHLHPAAKVSLHGHTFRRPCFVGNGRRLVMPSFGAYTGGLNVLDEAFHPLFGDEGIAVWVRGDEGIYPIAARQLRPD